MARKRYKPEKIGNMLREAVNRLGRLTVVSRFSSLDRQGF